MPASQAFPLRAALGSRSPQLLLETEAIIGPVTQLLWHTLSTFPSGTSHTPEHTAVVEQIAGMLVQPTLMSQLSDDELQALILACHIHDLGMAGTEHENLTDDARDQARRDHAIRIGERIRESWRNLGFRSEGQAEILAEVCRGHRPQKHNGKAHWLDIPESRVIGPGRVARLRAVSALVYAADELHIGSDRAPEREQDWLRIENEESCRHWKRHQCISGPGPAPDGNGLRFDARVSTSVLERDLRRDVFRKAFSAVHDATAELALAGLPALPPLSIQWIRDDLWKLVLLQVESDHRPRTDSELTDTLYERFLEQSSDCDKLDDLCSQWPSTDDDIKATIRRSISDFRCRSHLRPIESGGSRVRLDPEMRSAKVFFEIVRKADIVDGLFAGRFAANHEFDLLRSEYGKEFANVSLTPLVESGFGVNLSVEHHESAVLTAVRSSPTVARLLSEFPPAPSVLVKRHLLRTTVLAGLSLDLLRCPELLLNKELRHAVRNLTEMVAAQQPTFLHFIEELVLVGGFSYEQVHEAMLMSDAATQAMDEGVSTEGNPSQGQSVSFQISQKIPAHLPRNSVSFPHLVLAGVRTGAPIEILSTQETQLTVAPADSASGTVPAGPLSKVMIGPGKERLPGRIDVRASVFVDAEARLVELRCRMLNEAGNRELPIILSLPVQAMMTGAAGNFQIDYYDPGLDAQQLRSLTMITQLADSETVELRMVRESDGHRMACQELPVAEVRKLVPLPFHPALIDFLHSLRPEMPLPWWFPKDDLRKLAVLDEQMSVYEKFERIPLSDRPQITTIILRCASSQQCDYTDEYLGIFSHYFGPPKVSETSNISQEEMNAIWENPAEDLIISASYTDDYHHLADEVRKWSKNPSTPFPLNIAAGAPGTPVFKTRVEIVISPFIDRFWFVERPVLLRFRPILSHEQWQIEAAYWESVGQHERAEILRERLASLPREPDGSRPPEA